MRHCLLLLLVVLAACSARAVRCDQHLVPINPPAAKAAAAAPRGAP